MLITVIKFIRCYYYHMSRNELMLRAAALTYYAIFSIGPLLILISSIMGFILADPAKQQAMIDAIISLLPQGSERITDLLQDIIAARTASGVVAVLTLLWAGAGFFRGLLAAIDLIHSQAYTYNTFLMRAIGVIVILFVTPALFLLLFLSSLSSLIIASLPVVLPDYISIPLTFLGSELAVFFMASLAFYLMLHYVPSQRAPKRISLLSAVIIALAWGILSYGFAWYLNSGFARFNLLYGSIGAVMALMLYIYLTNMVVLLGAQLNAILARFAQCSAPYIPGLDDLLRKLHLPLPAIDEREQPSNKPMIAP